MNNHEVKPTTSEPPPARVYRGKPENQRDVNAQNAHRPRTQRPARANGPPANQKPSGSTTPARPSLNKPTLLEQNARTKHNTTSGNPADGAVFRESIAVRETRLRQTFTPSAPALVEISRNTFAELLTDDAQLGKALLPEFLDYYATAMLWLRIVHLKQKNYQPLTEEEQDVLTLVQTTNFCLPDPIFLQIRQIGNLITKTGQHLYPEFPDMPVALINGQPGYFGPIQLPAPEADPTIHNLYEELPCLGVLAEAVRQSISDAGPGPYV